MLDRVTRSSGPYTARRHPCRYISLDPAPTSTAAHR